MDDTERLVVLLEARVRDFERNMEKASGTAGREFGRMRKDANSASRQMEADMVRSTSRINQALATVSTRIGAMGAAFGPMAAGVAVGAAAVAGFAVQAREVAKEIATIGDEAKRAGISVKSFQELKFVADQNRVSIEALTDGIKEMNLRADEFIVTGSGSGAEAFKRLGLTATDLSKKLKDPSALFTEIIGKMEKMDRAAQIRISDEVFGGTGGEQFVQLIEQGEAGIRRTIEEANRLGIVMDEQMIAKAAEVDRQFGAISQTVETKLKGAIVNAASALADFMDGFRDFDNQRDSSLTSEMAAIGQKRLETETQIMKLRERRDGMGGIAGAIGLDDAVDRQIEQYEKENAALGEQEKQILDVLKARGALNTSLKETADGLHKLGDAGTSAGESFDYVSRNGGTATKTVDTYGKSIADLRSRLTDTVDGLQVTVDHFGESEGAIAAARFEADAMADALRAATTAGKGVVDPELATFIKGQAADYGRLTDKIAASTQAEQERQRVADKAKERQERVSTFETDLAFERSILTLPEAEQQVRTTLHDLDVDFDSYEGQRLAAGLRYNDALVETQDRMREMGELGKDVFFDLIDSIGDGRDALGSFAKAFSGIGKQMASGGFDKLFAGLLGKSTPSSPTSGGSGVLDAILGTGSVATQPSAIARQTSVKLADTVTKSVSSNLLSNILGAGKDENHISGLNTQFATALTSMLQAAPEAVRSAVTINSGFRSVARQAELFDGALKKYGSVAAARKWVAPPGNSQHNSGNAADLGYANDNAGSWMRANAGRFGLSFPMSHEPWHVQMAGGQGVTKAESQRLIETGVSKGMQRGLTEFDLGPYDPGTPSNPTGSQGVSRGQAGLGALMGIAGIAGSGYASGNPIAGGLSGAMGGIELGGMLGSAFPALGAAAGPLGIAAGAPIGRSGSPFNRKRNAA